MAEVVQLAVVAGVTGLLMSIAQWWLASKSKKEDYARQDAVAARVESARKQVEDAAKLLVNAQDETNRRTDEVAKLAVESDARIQEQLQKIHTLVNSDMTAARTNERNQTEMLVISLKRFKTLSEKLGLPVTTEEDETIMRNEKRIVELDSILADRLAAQHKIDEAAKR